MKKSQFEKKHDRLPLSSSQPLQQEGDFQQQHRTVLKVLYEHVELLNRVASATHTSQLRHHFVKILNSIYEKTKTKKSKKFQFQSFKVSF